MTSLSKMVLIALAIAGAGTIAYRETQAACAPAKAGGHDHGHGHGSEDASKRPEGFRARACEAGLMTALLETMTGASPTSIALANPDDGNHADGHDHDHGAAKPKAHAGDEHGHAHGKDDHEETEGFVKLSAQQIKAADITTGLAASGTLSKEIAVPGRITMNANDQARVVPKLTGTVASVTKQLGEAVSAGDLLATIESRDMADAKAEFLASSRAETLARATLEREERLWKQKVTAEQDYLAARNAHEDSKTKLEVAHQKLHAIGLSEEEIAKLPDAKDDGSFRLYEVRSPIAGVVTARDLILGQSVDTSKEIFMIANPAKVWVEMAISPNDLAFAQNGQEVRVRSGTRQGAARVIAVSPIIDPETRSAKAIAELDNNDGRWTSGDYVEAHLLSGAQPVDIVIPQSAIQTMKGAKVVFVDEGGGFRVRPITIGREDTTKAEVVSGLEFGETIAVSNTFTLKAELGKAEAEHEH